MKLLVTGGAGFIGSYFIRQWLSTKPSDEIINLDILSYAASEQTIAEFNKFPNYRFVRGDICDEKLVNDLVAEVDLIVHFAAESHVDRSILSSR